MTLDLTRLSDPRQFAENRMPAHSDHRWFASETEASAGVSSFEQCLNGVWKFHFAKNLAAAPAGFEAPGFDTSGWDDIAVPAHIQLEGYDRPQYVNTQYPWDGHEQIVPGQVPTRYNPVASYVTTFTLDQPVAAGERLSVSFKGAESALAVWLNGTWIGYGCDSFTPSEFDLTEALLDGENVLAAQVVKWSAASWLEDQDFYRFSGIFRDVVLHRRPATHLEDLRVTTTVDDDLAAAVVAVQTRLEGSGSIRARLDGVGALSDVGEGRLELRLENPHLWSAEDPHLHGMVIEVLDDFGQVSEVVVQRVGVRRFGIEGGLLRINGKRVVFDGVNRHEFGLHGRVMSRERTEADLALLKANNVNAIRTSHYPNNSFFYDLADEYGFYVIDEMNLETHGLWDEVLLGRRKVEDAVPGDNPDWYPALVDRATSFLERDKNHPCVVIWSLGNESYGGTNLLNLSNLVREFDPTRPVHYEGVGQLRDPRYPATTDIESQMYTPADEIEAYLKDHRDKPFILCEYAHVMGNSFGAVDKYTDLADREELYQGGFIWDFADQAIALVDGHGREYFGYGGDCGEAPHDSDFSGNGILFADHTPKPVVPEVKYLYQGFTIGVDRREFRLTSRMLFTASSAYECVVTLAREGRVLASGVVDTDVNPGESQTYALPFDLPEAAGEYTVDVSLRLRTATAWAAAGHEVASEQGVFVVEGQGRPSRVAPAPEVIDGIHNIGVRGRHFHALFSRIHGGLLSYRFGGTPDGGRELLRGIPRPNFWHAPTSNERGWGMQRRDGQWLLASQYASLRPGGENPRMAVVDDAVEVTYGYELASTPTTECDVTYQVDGGGRIEVTLVVRPGEGLPDAPEVGMLITTQPEFTQLRWYGDGPHECYVDRRGAARLGVHELDVREALTPYLRPQEAGSRTGVRWASVTDSQGRGLRFESSEPMEFSALPWTPTEIENAAHHVDLPPIQRTVLRPALMRRGVGGDHSWGAMTHPEYRLPEGELSFTFAFQGLL